MGKKCSLLFKWDARTIFEENIQIFSDIDALAVSMSEKFFAQLSFKKARVPYFNERILKNEHNQGCEEDRSKDRIINSDA